MAKKELALRVVLILVGLLFVAGIYPIVEAIGGALPAHDENALPMMLSLYVTLGVFLLVAARDPASHRGVIAFAAWSSFAHGAVMAVMSIRLSTERQDLLVAAGSLAFLGLLLLWLMPRAPAAQGARSLS